MKNNSALTLYVFLLISCLSLFSVNIISAQEKGIYEVSNNDSFKKNKGENNNNAKDLGYNTREGFYELAFKMHPTHYYENNALKSVYKSGDPVKLTFVDNKSFNLLKSKNSNYDKVELITIMLNSSNDLNNTIDLTNNTDLKNLKYVFIKCNFKCSEDQIQNFIKTNEEIRIFYSSQNPS